MSAEPIQPVNIPIPPSELERSLLAAHEEVQNFKKTTGTSFVERSQIIELDRRRNGSWLPISALVAVEEVRPSEPDSTPSETA